jgi:hypothetical protein
MADLGLQKKSWNRDSRVFSSSSWNFRSKHALYWKFGTLAGLRSRPQAQMAMNHVHKTCLVLRPFEEALTCSILIAGTQVLLIRKAYFLRRGSGLRLESWTPRPHTNGLMFKISALWVLYRLRNSGQTDGRDNDFSRAHFYWFHSKNFDFFFLI